MRDYKDEGIVLKSNKSGEADLILTVFSRSYGKIRLKAKSVRRINSRRSGNVENFNCIKFSVVKGKQFDILTEVDLVDSYSGLKNNLTKVGIAYHYVELVDRLLAEGESNHRLYELLKKKLLKLAKVELEISSLREEVIDFEIALLEDIGFGLPEDLSQRSLVKHIESVIEKPLKSRKFLIQIASNKAKL